LDMNYRSSRTQGSRMQGPDAGRRWRSRGVSKEPAARNPAATGGVRAAPPREAAFRPLAPPFGTPSAPPRRDEQRGPAAGLGGVRGGASARGLPLHKARPRVLQCRWQVTDLKPHSVNNKVDRPSNEATAVSKHSMRRFAPGCGGLRSVFLGNFQTSRGGGAQTTDHTPLG